MTLFIVTTFVIEETYIPNQCLRILIQLANQNSIENMEHSIFIHKFFAFSNLFKMTFFLNYKCKVR